MTWLNGVEVERKLRKLVGHGGDPGATTGLRNSSSVSLPLMRHIATQLHRGTVAEQRRNLATVPQCGSATLWHHHGVTVSRRHGVAPPHGNIRPLASRPSLRRH